jgi:hypothetical protein
LPLIDLVISSAVWIAPPRATIDQGIDITGVSNFVSHSFHCGVRAIPLRAAAEAEMNDWVKRKKDH